MQQGFDEACFDVAIEAYLLGGKISKFGYSGEDTELVKKRCEEELKHFIDTFIISGCTGLRWVYRMK